MVIFCTDGGNFLQEQVLTFHLTIEVVAILAVHGHLDACRLKSNPSAGTKSLCQVLYQPNSATLNALPSEPPNALPNDIAQCFQSRTYG